MSNPRTLYDDWKARREQLAQLPYSAGDHHAIEAHVLDFLLQLPKMSRLLYNVRDWT